MGDDWKKIIYRSAAEENLLHLTSCCPYSCIFCSNNYNPEGIRVYAPGHLPFPMLLEALALIDPARIIRTGESTSRVTEGDPLCHPDFFRLMEVLRELYPQTRVEIVTSIASLGGDILSRLQELEPMSLKISLNMITPSLRQKLLGDSQEVDIRSVLEKLCYHGFLYSFTVVAVPHLSGWDELMKTILTGGSYLPREITVYRPGWTRKTPVSLRPGVEMEGKLEGLVEELAYQLAVPLLLEPPKLKDLKARVAGVYRDSPASNAGLEKDDLILEVGGEKPLSRLDAHKLLEKGGGTLEIMFSRQGITKRAVLEKAAGKKSGLIFHRDLPGYLPAYISRISRGRNAVLITSRLAGPLMKSIFPGTEPRVLPVENEKLGGSIAVTGLLSIEDILQACRKYAEDDKLDLVILPAKLLDEDRRDLWGERVCRIEEELGVQAWELSG